VKQEKHLYFGRKKQRIPGKREEILRKTGREQKEKKEEKEKEQEKNKRNVI